MLKSTSAPPPQSNGATGFFPHSIGYFSALAGYLSARLQLAGIETKEASGHYAVIVALFAATIILGGLGYLFLCLAAIFLIASAFPQANAWIWVTLAMAALHFIAALCLAWLAKNRLAQPMFESTIHEFRKDQEWLNSKSENRN